MAEALVQYKETC